MSATIYAANWKMHLAPGDGRALVQAVLGRVPERAGRTLVFFPPAVALPIVAEALAGRTDTAAGIQNVHWEPKGAFTGEISAPMAAASGAAWALIGHSERRHKFGETDEETGRKVRAVQGAGLHAMLCVGETIEQRKAGETEAVVVRQLGAALDGLDPAAVAQVVIAYEPVWAIGTGLNATPEDAAAVHRVIRSWLASRVPAGKRSRILYGGSVNAKNAAELLAQDELDGVLVGGASLEADGWVQVCGAR